MTLLHTITHPSRLHNVKFCKRVVGDGEVLLVAAEDKKLSIYDIPSDRTEVPTVIAEMVGHANRVKAVDTLSVALPHAAPRSSTTVVSTISSDGKVRLYDMAALPESSKEKTQLEPVAEYDTKGTRLTCLAMADGEVMRDALGNGKRKRDEHDEGEHSADDDEPFDSDEGEESADDDDDDADGR